MTFFEVSKEIIREFEIPENEHFEVVGDGFLSKPCAYPRIIVGMPKYNPLGGWDIMDALIPKILKYCPGDIVEIGVGESTTIFAKLAQEAGVKLHSCDIEMGGRYKLFDKELFEDHICYNNGSEEFIKEYDGHPSIVFLDGDHRYTTVKMEVDFFLARLLDGGVMFMHDTMPKTEGFVRPPKGVENIGVLPGDSYRMRQELERNPEVDVFTWPYSALDMGLTMVMKHVENRPYWKINGRSCWKP